MFLRDAHGDRIALSEIPFRGARRGRDALRDDSPVARAHRAFFELRRGVEPTAPPPTAFREVRTGRVRTFYREIVVRFREGTPPRSRQRLLVAHDLEVRKTNRFVPGQVVVVDATRSRGGCELVELANYLTDMDEVAFATPNFVSEYRRDGLPIVPVAQWHLLNRGRLPGQRAGEDVGALEAWEATRGVPSIVVAILDDGVDLDHPNLRANVWRNGSKRGRDRNGRDFFVPDDDPGHYDPRPKKSRYPYDAMEGNDIHGTPCAGIVAASGKGAWGIAPGCRILAVKVFHADELAADERVADAVRYAARRADVLSCSWTAATSPDLQFALQDAGWLGRRGKGAPVLCAAGNDGGKVEFPARDPHAIAVGASTDAGELAEYSSRGSGLDVVAPSSGGVAGIFTTDVSQPGRGFNPGRAGRGGKDGLHTLDFGGTSSATPLAAGVAALALSVNPRLDRDAVREILVASAERIGGGRGYRRVHAGRAVAMARGEIGG